MFSYADFDLGDYHYSEDIDWPGNVSVRVRDKTKSSYSDIPSTVTYDGQTYTVWSASSCFENCANLISTPSIPSTVENMNGCYGSCTSLRNVTTNGISSGVYDMDYCFEKCTSLQSIPSISLNRVTSMRHCFSGCTSLKSTFSLPNSVNWLHKCFYNCSSLKNVASIPANARDVRLCFSGCTSLSGEIIVKGDPSEYNGIFDGTLGQIYIIPYITPMDGQGGTAPNVWRTIASGYDNVHYYLDDVEMSLVGSACIRVSSDRSTVENENGTYGCYMVAFTCDFVPPDETLMLSYTYNMNGESANPTRYKSELNAGVYVLTAWFQIGDDIGRLNARISDNIRNAISAKLIVPPKYALLEFREEEKGLAIGRVASRENVDILSDTTFSGRVSMNGGELLPMFAVAYAPPDDMPYLMVDPEYDPCIVYSAYSHRLFLYSNRRYKRIGS